MSNHTDNILCMDGFYAVPDFVLDRKNRELANMESRIAELEAELRNQESLHKAIAEWKAKVAELEAAIKTLQEATYTVPGMLCHKMVGEAELFAVFAAAAEGENKPAGNGWTWEERRRQESLKRRGDE